MGEEVVWLVLNLKRSFVLAYQNYQVKIVKPKGFQLTSLISMVFKFINVGFMVHRTQTSMALEIEQIEVGLTSQDIQMRRRLNLLQV